MKITFLIAAILFSAILKSSPARSNQVQDNQWKGPDFLLYNLTDNSYTFKVPKIFTVLTFYNNIKMYSGETVPLYIDSSVLISAKHYFFKKITEIENEGTQDVEQWMSNFNLSNNPVINSSSENSDSDKKIELEDWMSNTKSWIKVCKSH